jgi:hypothetical protein
MPAGLAQITGNQILSSTRREAHMKYGTRPAFLLLILSVVLAGCVAYPYNHYRSGDGYYYYGPDTYNPTYFGPF